MRKKHLMVSIILLLILVFFFTTRVINDFIENEKNPEVVIENMSNDKDGIYVFGFSDCPWCQELYPVLNEVLDEFHEKANYVDTHSVNFTQKDRVALKKYMQKKTKYDDVVVPFLVMISEDGTYQYHVGTIEGHDASKDKLTVNQEIELKNNIRKMIFKYKKNEQILNESYCSYKSLEFSL